MPDAHTTKVPLVWELGHSESADKKPVSYIPATVPGAVQLDWARAHGWPPHYKDREPERYGVLEDLYFTYRARLEPQRLAPDEVLVLVLRGVDYAFSVLLDGVVVHEQEGMYRPVELDVSASALLEVALRPVPRAPGEQGRRQAKRTVKPAVSYGWDFHPRLVPLGIWDDAYLEVRPRAHVVKCHIETELSDDLASAEVRLEATLSDVAGRELTWSVRDASGNVVVELRTTLSDSLPEREAVRLSARIDAPKLWWPHDHGEPHLYTSNVTLVSAEGRRHVVTRRFGIRRVKLVVFPGGWRSGLPGPNSCAKPPATLEINGRTIFVKGANWVPPTMFPGTMDREIYASLVGLARRANMNMLRVWGGGCVNKEPFYDLCDELGLLVWQDFTLACIPYPDDANYLSVLDAESVAIIERLREHACLAIWCGGNELFEDWSRMTCQSKPLRLLGRNTFDLDPNTPFMPSSPQEGVGHGDYRFYDDRGREVYEIYASSSCTAYTEFGMPGPASLEVLSLFMSNEDIERPLPGGVWEYHGAYNAWYPGEHESWLYPSVCRRYFGEARDTAQLIEQGQLLQSEGYRAIYEEVRRQKPRAGMALAWCLNEPWPTSANNSIISWPDKPKPAYEAVKLACRPTLLSAKLEKYLWRAGELFAVDLWLLHDGSTGLPAGHARAKVRLGDRVIDLGSWSYGDVRPNQNVTGPTLHALLPDVPSADRMVLCLESDEGAFDSVYTLAYRSSTID